MDELKSTLSLCHLVDLGYKCDKFTWKRRDQKGETIKERLDKFVANMNFIDKEFKMEVNHLNYFHSDHKPIILSSEKQGIKKRRFKWPRKPNFEESWLQFEECKIIVSEYWNGGRKDNAEDINHRVESIQLKLSVWNRDRLKGSIQGAVNRKLREIQDLEKDHQFLGEEKVENAEKELCKLFEEKEIYWKMRSREDWL